MNKFRALIVSLVLAISSIAIGVTATVSPASAWTASCQYAPTSAYTTPQQYGGAFCSVTRVGGAFHRVVINCKYVLFGISHTYNVTGPYAADFNWSWANCGNHLKDGPNPERPDWIIHIHADFDPPLGGNTSGSW